MKTLASTVLVFTIPGILMAQEIPRLNVEDARYPLTCENETYFFDRKTETVSFFCDVNNDGRTDYAVIHPITFGNPTAYAEDENGDGELLSEEIHFLVYSPETQQKISDINLEIPEHTEQELLRLYNSSPEGMRQPLEGDQYLPYGMSGISSKN